MLPVTSAHEPGRPSTTFVAAWNSCSSISGSKYVLTLHLLPIPTNATSTHTGDCSLSHLALISQWTSNCYATRWLAYTVYRNSKRSAVSLALPGPTLCPLLVSLAKKRATAIHASQIQIEVQDILLCLFRTMSYSCGIGRPSCGRI